VKKAKIFAAFTLLCASLFAQKQDAYKKGDFYRPAPRNMVGRFGENYDSAKADRYKKLDTLDRLDGKGKIKTALEWQNEVRPQVMDFVCNTLYTPLPPRPESLEFKLLERDGNALEGKAVRMQYKIISRDALGEHAFTLLVYAPKNAKKAPVFINANYCGNHTVCDEKRIIMPTCYLRNSSYAKIDDHRAHERQRGIEYPSYPVREIVARGYGFATFCYHELYPDKHAEKQSGFDESVYKIFDKSKLKGAPHAIAAWAYGKIRALDCVETIPELDASRAYVVGLSRLGKAALYAGALDARFAGVFSTSSCILGTSMNRRDFGGTLKIATAASPFWYGAELSKYADRIEDMPIDQQHLLACIAPRPLYVASSTNDYWCDPVGEFLSLLESSKIYALYGAKKLPQKSDMKIETPFFGDVGYHLRIGSHDITPYDWAQYMNYLDTLRARDSAGARE